MTAILVELDKTSQNATLLKIGQYADMPGLLTSYTTMYKGLETIGIHAEAYVLDLDSMNYTKEEQGLITGFLIGTTVNTATYDMALALSKNNMLAVKQHLNKMINVETT